MSQIIAITNQKGGVGKTTTTAHLAVALGRRGKRVLVVDMDGQGCLTEGLGVRTDDLEMTAYDVLVDQVPVGKVVIEGVRENVDLLPADTGLFAADMALVNVMQREFRLRNALEAVVGAYDFILIDCPPNLSWLTLNSLTAAGSYIVALEPEYYSYKGTKQLHETIDMLRSNRVNPDLRAAGILLTKVDARKGLHRDVSESAREQFGTNLFNTVIRTDAAIANAQADGVTVFESAPNSRGAQDYQALADELISKGE